MLPSESELLKSRPRFVHLQLLEFPLNTNPTAQSIRQASSLSSNTKSGSVKRENKVNQWAKLNTKAHFST